MSERVAKLMAVAGGVMACAAGARGQVTIVPNVAYASPGMVQPRNVLDVYLPSGPASVRAGRPVAVVVHGGGYTSGSKADVRWVCQGLASMGFAAVAPNYSLTTGTYAGSPQAMRDVSSVVRWVRTAGRDAYGWSDAVVVTGFSAGATIGVAAGLGAAGGAFVDPPAVGTGVRSAPDVIVGFYGRYDLVWNSQFNMPGYVYQFLGAWPGSAGFAAASAQASATTYAGPCTAPTALWHGALDATVPVGNSQRLFQALTTAGANVRLTISPDGGHSTGALGGDWGAAEFIAAETARLAGTGCQAWPASPAGACCTGLECAPAFAFTCVGAFAASTTCQATNCFALAGLGSCCEVGQCAVTTASDCFGDFVLGEPCAPAVCPVSADMVACCYGRGCYFIAATQCAGAFTRSLGPGTVCSAQTTPPTWCCPADFNQSGAATIDDLFVFLTAWFGTSGATDYTGDRVVSLDDIFVYLNVWFAGC